LIFLSNFEKMKSFVVNLMVALSLSACTRVVQVGQINLISNRNIDKSENYELLNTYQGSDRKFIKKSRATSIQQAVDNTVRTVPGGEYLMNVKIYQINRRYFAVEGDVYGNKKNANMRGFQVGDSVLYVLNKKVFPGAIIKIINTASCIVHFNTGKVLEKKFDELTLIPKKEETLDSDLE
jgi:hypothetical protein